MRVSMRRQYVASPITEGPYPAGVPGRHALIRTRTALLSLRKNRTIGFTGAIMVPWVQDRVEMPINTGGGS